MREVGTQSRPEEEEEEEEAKVALCRHGNIYAAHQTSSPSPAHVLAGKQGPREAWLERILDV